MQREAEIIAAVKKLRQDHESLSVPERLELGEALEDSVLDRADKLPSRLLRPLAVLLARDPWYEVRKKVANIVHLLEPEIGQELCQLLLQDDNSHVRSAAQRGSTRRWKRHRHQSHVQRVMDHVVALSEEFYGERHAGTDRRSRSGTTGTSNQEMDEAMTLDHFMLNYCQKTTYVSIKKTSILAAGRNGTIKLPPLARPAHRGRPSYFYLQDLLECWPQWQAQGLQLPDLLPIHSDGD